VTARLKRLQNGIKGPEPKITDREAFEDGKLKDLLDAMNQECQITNGPQFMSKFNYNGMYWLHCSTEGCCDAEMTETEARQYLASDDVEWTVIRE
jgi:hypothetical protein